MAHYEDGLLEVMSDITEAHIYTFEDCKAAIDFLMKWPEPLKIQEIVDPEERQKVLDQYFKCLDIVKWSSSHR